MNFRIPECILKIFLKEFQEEKHKKVFEYPVKNSLIINKNLEKYQKPFLEKISDKDCRRNSKKGRNSQKKISLKSFAIFFQIFSRISPDPATLEIFMIFLVIRSGISQKNRLRLLKKPLPRFLKDFIFEDLLLVFLMKLFSCFRKIHMELLHYFKIPEISRRNLRRNFLMAQTPRFVQKICDFSNKHFKHFSWDFSCSSFSDFTLRFFNYFLLVFVKLFLQGLLLQIRLKFLQLFQ